MKRDYEEISDKGFSLQRRRYVNQLHKKKTQYQRGKEERHFVRKQKQNKTLLLEEIEEC